MPVYADFFENVSVGFIKSGTKDEHFPDDTVSEFALLGRSNVGKSSFLNHIFETQSLVKVSKQPGKTRLINFFHFTDDITFVDLPGYGYAKVSHGEREKWSHMIADFCENRKPLKGIIWLIDYRRGEGTDIDREAANWLVSLGIPVFVVLTKTDKLTQKERVNNLRSLKQLYSFSESTPLLPYSVTKVGSRVKFWKLFHSWVELL